MEYTDIYQNRNKAITSETTPTPLVSSFLKSTTKVLEQFSINAPLACSLLTLSTAQKMKFSIMDYFSMCAGNCRKLRIWSHLLKKSLIENLIFCAMKQLFIQYLRKILSAQFCGIGRETGMWMWYICKVFAASGFVNQLAGLLWWENNTSYKKKKIQNRKPSSFSDFHFMIIVGSFYFIKTHESSVNEYCFSTIVVNLTKLTKPLLTGICCLGKAIHVNHLTAFFIQFSFRPNLYRIFF